MPSTKKLQGESSTETPSSGAADARPEETIALSHFLDVPVTVSVELARKKVNMRDILNLKVDMVIEMDQSAGENVDLRLNGITAGNGEIVVIEDMMGLRVTDLKVRPADRDRG